MISQQHTSPLNPNLAAAFHPLPNLLALSAHEILAFYKTSQLRDFTRTLQSLQDNATDLCDQIEVLGGYAASYPTPDFRRRIQATAVERLFRDMHDHVMSHPVWVHPFFVRVAAGDITLQQLKIFARHYFNQVKNTRQCVALALGRFHSFMERPERELSIAMSEMTQVILAGLLTDEYGTAASHARCDSSSVDIGKLFSPITHPALFRRFLDALGVPLIEQDVPMLQEVADNVLVQRILAGNPAYNELEALASVGLGMEWGVPAFFSMLIAGILKTANREGLDLSPDAMEIWSSHVQQDVQHAIAVTIATSFFVRDEPDLARIRGATNILMAFRYDMMSAICEEVFESPCGRIAAAGLDPRYVSHDQRMESLLLGARLQVSPRAVRDHEGYVRNRNSLPFR